jgi:hypothetical protein
MATAWQNIPAVLSLRDEFNRIAPNRATGADGTVGDLDHQQRSSDHNPDETGAVPIRDADKVNEVHALDITTDLRTPGLTMEDVVQFLLARCRSGAEKRLRYIIFNRRIWEASNGWRQRAYNLADPHTGHAHFSFSYDSKREADASPWHLEDIPVALTADDKKWIGERIDNAVAKIFKQTFTNPYDGRKMEYGTMLAYAPSKGQVEDVGKQVEATRKEILAVLAKPAPAAGQ